MNNFNNCVYRFLNKYNEIIYIGKAKNLKSRLSSHNHLPKECYEERERIEFIYLNNEFDMDLAERYFITKINPKYNTVLNKKNTELCLSEFDNAIWINYGEFNNNDYIYNNENNLIENLSDAGIKSNKYIIESINNEINELKNILSYKKDTYFNYMRHKEAELHKKFINSKEVKDAESNGYFLASDEFVKVKSNDRLDYNDILTPKGVDYMNYSSYRNQMDIAHKEILKVESILNKTIEKRIMTIIGKDKFDNLPKKTKEIFIKYNCCTLEELEECVKNRTVERKIKELEDFIEKYGYYRYTELYYSIIREYTFSNHITGSEVLRCIDDSINCENYRWKNSFTTPKLRNIIKEIIHTIENKLKIKYGQFLDDIIIERDCEIGIDMEIDKAILIKRVAHNKLNSVKI